MKKHLRLVFATLTLAATLAGAAYADSAAISGSGPDAGTAADREAAAEKYFTNVELVNQDGETMHLYQDLIKDKIVVINAVFTTCSGVCPVMGTAFQAIQERLGDRLGKDVHLISITLDPETDTPPVLKAYSARFKARPGWYFLSGDKANVEFALGRLGQFVEEKESHQAVILIGNERTGLWKKVFGLAPKSEILEVVESVLDDQG